MKLKFLRNKLPSPIEGVRSAIIPDTLSGDVVAVAKDDNVLLVKLSDLVEFINQQEATEARGDSSCPA